MITRNIPLSDLAAGHVLVRGGQAAEVSAVTRVRGRVSILFTEGGSVAYPAQTTPLVAIVEA